MGENAGIPYLQRAIELDPDFASAYSALALCCNNLGLLGEARRYMQRAYELRERATERERIRIVAGYHDIELTKIVERPGLVKNFLVLPLAQAQLA